MKQPAQTSPESWLAEVAALASLVCSGWCVGTVALPAHRLASSKPSHPQQKKPCFSKSLLLACVRQLC